MDRGEFQFRPIRKKLITEAMISNDTPEERIDNSLTLHFLFFNNDEIGWKFTHDLTTLLINLYGINDIRQARSLRQVNLRLVVEDRARTDHPFIGIILRLIVPYTYPVRRKSNTKLVSPDPPSIVPNARLFIASPHYLVEFAHSKSLLDSWQIFS